MSTATTSSFKDPTSRHWKYISMAADTALSKSTTVEQIGAVLRVSSATTATGASKWERQTVNGSVLAMSMHAETEVLRLHSLHNKRMFRHLLKKNATITHTNSIIYIARASVSNGAIKYKLAQPCIMCLRMMWLYGIRWVCFTINDHEFRLIRVRDLLAEPAYTTRGTIRLNNMISYNKYSKLFGL